MIRGKRWRVVDSAEHRGVELGYCTHPELDREIAIPLDGDSESELDTICHEVLHACQWDLSEEAIEETACSLAHTLWRLGWRKD
jgi:hypothetical protein